MHRKKSYSHVVTKDDLDDFFQNKWDLPLLSCSVSDAAATIYPLRFFYSTLIHIYTMLCPSDH